MKRLIVFLLILACCVFPSCGKAEQYTEKTFFCMDTALYLKLDTDDNKIFDKIIDLINDLDKALSRHNGEGETSLFNGSVDGCMVGSDIKELLIVSEKISAETDGAFSVFAGGLTKLWEESEVYPTSDAILSGVQSVVPAILDEDGFLKKSNKDTLLEFGGIAKGYACDKAVEMLKACKIESGMVSFTSSIAVFGENPQGTPWRIALKDPMEPQSIMGYLTLGEGFISVSGDYERAYDIDGVQYNHIIDVKTGLPVDNGVHGVVVIAQSGAESDALSTAFFVMGHERVKEKYYSSDDIKYLIVTDEGIFMNESMSKCFTKN